MFDESGNKTLINTTEFDVEIKVNYDTSNYQTGFWNSTDISSKPVVGSFINNDVSSWGGAISNQGTIGDITGDFVGNYAKLPSGQVAVGGAISNIVTVTSDGIVCSGVIENWGTIDNIKGVFTGNYAQSESNYAYSGAINNGSTIGNIVGNFEGNYVQSTSGEVLGGAINNLGQLII